MCEATYKQLNKRGSKLYWAVIQHSKDGNVDLWKLQDKLTDDIFEDVLWTWQTLNIWERS